MLDYIGGDIVRTTRLRSGHQVVLRHRHTDDGEAVEQPFHVRGDSPGETGHRLVAMLLEDEVAGWHNQTTGEQGHLLRSLPRLRWRLRDAGIATAATVFLHLAGKPLWGWAGGLGWLVSVALWRFHALRDVRRELVTALQLAAGVSRRKDPG